MFILVERAYMKGNNTYVIKLREVALTLLFFETSTTKRIVC